MPGGAGVVGVVLVSMHFNLEFELYHVIISGYNYTTVLTIHCYSGGNFLRGIVIPLLQWWQYSLV